MFGNVADLEEFQTEAQVLTCLMHIHTKLCMTKCAFTFAAGT